MEKAWGWAKKGFALIGVLALGFWLGSARSVRASSDESASGVLQFQLTSVNPASSLLVYQPKTNTVYVYQGATIGNSALQCSFMFQLERAGQVIRRVPCEVPKLIP